MIVIDYNMKKTSDLERLLKNKQNKLNNGLYNKYDPREKLNLEAQIAHIQAVLTGRKNTLPLDL